MACAWIAFSTYFLMMVSSYFVGRKYYPVNYDIKNAVFYTVIAMIFYFLGIFLPIEHVLIRLIVRFFLIGNYLFVVLIRDLPFREIPVLNNFFKIYFIF